MSGGGGGNAGNSGQIPQGEPFTFYPRRSIITAVSTAGDNLAADNSSFDITLNGFNLDPANNPRSVTASLINANFINTFIPSGNLPNPLILEANFIDGDGINPQGQPSQILAMIPHKNDYYVTFEQSFQLAVPCTLSVLQTSDASSNPIVVTFTLKDGAGNLVNGGGEWAVQVRLEWEEQESYEEARDNRNFY